MEFFAADLTEITDETGGPARGWYRLYPFRLEEDPDFEALQWCLVEEESCALALVDIGAFRSRPLDAAALSRLRDILGFFRDHGKDVILRVAYDTEGHGPEREPRRLFRVTRHIRQLGSVIRDWADGIVLYQGMLVGSWGEMHGSGLLSARHMRRLDHVLEKSFGGVIRTVRTPAQWRTLRPDFPDSGTRLGLFNDAVFGSDTDMGTFAPAENPGRDWEERWPLRRELEFESRLRNFVPQCGEAVLDRTRGRRTLADTVSRLERMGMTYLNSVYDGDILTLWRSQTWEGRGPWQGMNGYDYIGRHLGYRFHVGSAAARRDGDSDFCRITLEIVNTGFSGFYQEADVWLILAHPDGREEMFLTDWDVRRWKAGESTSCEWRLPCRQGKLWLSARRKWDHAVIPFANGATERGRAFIGWWKGSANPPD